MSYNVSVYNSVAEFGIKIVKKDETSVEPEDFPKGKSVSNGLYKLLLTAPNSPFD